MPGHVSIDTEVDYREWEAATHALERRLWRATFRATQRGQYVIERNVKMYLRTFTHPFGTPTPSPRGGPPALVSGHLRRTWRDVPAHEGKRPHTVESEGGPTAVYSRIQELGGWAGRNHASHLPKRPYVRPMMLVSRREIRRIYIEHWTAAIRG
jgi:hypothetical protein